MASSYITDLGNLAGTSALPELKHSTSRKNDTTELDMTDFLTLMVVQLQNQSIDNTMDTSDMLNQMVQMQMITALTNMTDASVMSYASSLVGKEVTIGDYSTGELVEKVVTITGSGVSNGKNVLFAGDEVYNLSSVMAVGRLPEIKEPEEPGEGGDNPDDSVEGPDEPGDKPPVEGGDGTDNKPPVEGGDGTDDNPPVEGGDGTDDNPPVEGGDGTDDTPPVEGDAGSGDNPPAEGAESGDGTGKSGGIESQTSNGAAAAANGSLTAEQTQALISFLREKGIELGVNPTEEELTQAVKDFQALQTE